MSAPNYSWHRHSQYTAPPSPPPHRAPHCMNSAPSPSLDLVCSYRRRHSIEPYPFQQEGVERNGQDAGPDGGDGKGGGVAGGRGEGEAEEEEEEEEAGECVEDQIDAEADKSGMDQRGREAMAAYGAGINGKLLRLQGVRDGDGDGDWLDLRLGSFAMDSVSLESEQMLMHRRNQTSTRIKEDDRGGKEAGDGDGDDEEDGADQGFLTLQLLPRRVVSRTASRKKTKQPSPWKLASVNPCVSADIDLDRHRHLYAEALISLSTASSSSSSPSPSPSSSSSLPSPSPSAALIQQRLIAAPSLHTSSRIYGSFFPAQPHPAPADSCTPSLQLHSVASSVGSTNKKKLGESMELLPWRAAQLRSSVAGFWFALQPEDPQDQAADEDVNPKPYLRIKDGDVPIHAVKKYLAAKLGLSSESQVELRCRGRCLPENASLRSVRDEIWAGASRNLQTLSFTSSRSANPNPNPNPSNMQLVKECVPILSYHIARPSSSCIRALALKT